jgi:hypothetical protein
LFPIRRMVLPICTLKPSWTLPNEKASNVSLPPCLLYSLYHSLLSC